MTSLSKTTRDHEEIRRWAEERGGKPAHVKGTGSSGDVGILRIEFPGYSGEGTLEPITWDQFFEKFDERDLSLLYEEEPVGGERSNFNKIISAETAEEVRTAGPKKTKKAAKKSIAKKPVPKKAAAKKAVKKAAAKAQAKKAIAKGKKTASKKSSAKKAPARKTAAKRRR